MAHKKIFKLNTNAYKYNTIYILKLYHTKEEKKCVMKNCTWDVNKSARR